METLGTAAQQIFRILQEPIFALNSAKISVLSLLVSGTVVFLTIRIARLIGRGVNRALARREVESGVRDSLEKFARYALIAIGFLFALDNLGISISSLAAAGAVLMVGIGFGLQNITQNFISGIIILIERPIKVGDVVTVGSTSGRVIDIRVRSTVIRTRDDVTIIVPNSKFISEDVLNDSYSGQKIRQHVRVGVAYGSDVERVKTILRGSVVSHTSILAEPPPVVIFENFGDSSLDFDLRFWTNDLWTGDAIRSDVRTEIDRRFREAGVEIPFPQRDVHIKRESPPV